MNIFEKSIILAFIMTILFSISSFENKCESVSNKVLRLHIIANSDYGYDQDLKLKVRDKILNYSGSIFSGAKNRDEAKTIAGEDIDQIKYIAQNEVYSRGYDYPVNVEITNMYFTTRVYDMVTLPAGNYDAVRVTIGEAKGHNWWCVMFPQLCLGSAKKDEIISEVLNKDETDIVTKSEKYEIKFKVVEIFTSFKNWVRDLFK